MSTLVCSPETEAQLDFDTLLQKVHEIGREALAPHAADVDRNARFPREAFDAIKTAKLMSAYVPTEYGGMGLNLIQISEICEAFGHYCGSSAMIYAMHCIQVACVVHHGQESSFFRDYLRELVQRQLLMASATTEVGTGGDLRSSICAVDTCDGHFTITKRAPVISYGMEADDLLITCRRSSSSPSSDQVQLMVRKGEFTATPLETWDTMGFRGTCSSGFTVSGSGDVAQILPTPFDDILTRTMHPYSHIVWGALWCGIAGDAVNRARSFVRAEARKTPGETPLSAIRLSEVDCVMQETRHNVASLAREYQGLLDENCAEAFKGFGFSIRTNNLKITTSQRIVEIVGKALLICGISGYRNDSKFSLARHLRDAYGAALMVNNDRITKLNATLQTVHREGH